jgi:hypothetical protein
MVNVPYWQYETVPDLKSENRNPKADKAETASPRERLTTPLRARSQCETKPISGRNRMGNKLPILRGPAPDGGSDAGRQCHAVRNKANFRKKTRPRRPRYGGVSRRHYERDRHAKQSQFWGGGFAGQPGASGGAYPTVRNKANLQRPRWPRHARGWSCETKPIAGSPRRNLRIA